ncbi:MAG: hypothetical protein ACOY4R_22750 [Pseudomonadota bacterium]
MTMRSIKWAAGVSLVAVLAAGGIALPEREASAQVQAVPREGVAFNDSITQRVKIETLDPDDRTVAFTRPDGQVLVLPVAEGAGNLAGIADGSTANVTYTQVVTMLNLRQKGPGSRDARQDQMNVKPNKTDIEAGRFTLTVTAVDLANNTVSVIGGDGGPVRTLKATSIAKQDMLKKIKAGDVVIGLTTPLMVTRITPAN